MKREELIEHLARAMRLADIGEALEASSPEEREAFEAAWFTTDQWIRDKWLRPAQAVLARLDSLQLAVVPKERNETVAEFLKSDETHLLFTDKPHGCLFNVSYDDLGPDDRCVVCGRPGPKRAASVP